MRIAFYTDQVYKFGGIEKVLSHKMNYLTKFEDLEIILITSEQKGKSPFFSISDSVLKCDLNINYDRNKSYLFPTNLMKIPKHIARLNKCLSEVRPDILIVANFGIDFYLIPFLKKSIYKVKEFHSSRHYYFKDRQRTKSPFKLFKYKVNDLIESKYDKLVVLTSDEQKYYASKTEVIPNALISGFSNISSLNNKRVISAGRLAPVKGFDKLINAWKIVNRQNPDWELLIYGEGNIDYKNQLLEQIESLHLSNSITLAGVTNTMTEKMKEASIYAMSSVNECFPLVLLEAQACGLPVVSFDCPNGPRNIVNDGENGLLARDHDVVNLAEKLNELIEDNDKRTRFGKQSQIDVQRFNEERVMSKWMAIINGAEVNSN